MSSISFTRPVALTRRNLKSLDDLNKTIMPPKTPDSKSKAGSHATSTTSNDSVNATRAKLDRNHIFIDGIEAQEREEVIIDKAMDISRSSRESAMKSDTAKELRRLSNKYATAYELTWMVNVWGDFLKPHHTRLVELVKEGVLSEQGDLLNENAAKEYIQKAWEKDNLWCNWGAPFTTGSVPPLVFPKSLEEDEAAGIPRVKNPKPDLAYGLEEKAFTNKELKILEKHGAYLERDLIYPSFTVDAS